jgi:hypothetical protein
MNKTLFPSETLSGIAYPKGMLRRERVIEFPVSRSEGRRD